MSRAAHAQGASRRLELPGLDAASKPELAEWRSTGPAELAGGVARAGDVLSDAECVLPGRLGAVQPDCPRSDPPACGSGRSVSENILRRRTGPANVRTRARPILTCTRKPLRKLLYLASSDRRGCLAGPRRTAALAMRSCRAAQSQTTRADQGGHLRVERPLCGVRMRDSAVGGEGCCCADKGRSHVIMEDSVLFSSLPGRHGGVHSHPSA